MLPLCAPCARVLTSHRWASQPTNPKRITLLGALLREYAVAASHPSNRHRIGCVCVCLDSKTFRTMFVQPLSHSIPNGNSVRIFQRPSPTKRMHCFDPKSRCVRLFVCAIFVSANKTLCALGFCVQAMPLRLISRWDFVIYIVFGRLSLHKARQ